MAMSVTCPLPRYFSAGGGGPQPCTHSHVQPHSPPRLSYLPFFTTATPSCNACVYSSHIVRTGTFFIRSNTATFSLTCAQDNSSNVQQGVCDRDTKRTLSSGPGIGAPHHRHKKRPVQRMQTNSWCGVIARQAHSTLTSVP